MKGDKNTTISEMRKIVQEFRDMREWGQFHRPKELAAALAIETSELQELFLWKEADEVDDLVQSDPRLSSRVSEELADIFIFAIHLANVLNYDISELIDNKLALTSKRYPIEKSKGSAAKYDEL